jgi:6-pyruvoyltetrahydropterin/6-carboxytetrahydropterin synthase
LSTKPILYISRHAHFNAAHKLFNSNFDEKWNDETFGPCANKNWHGHNFELIVTVKGSPNPDTGFVMDLKVLSKIIKEEVTEVLDHKNLNLDVPALKDVLPSIEHIVIFIWGQIKVHLPEGVELHKIHLRETNNNFVEYYG